MRFRRRDAQHDPAPAADTRDDRDQGSALVLCLVFMIVGAMVVVPLINYAVVVLKANTVLSTKTRKVESVKAGLRVALSDPVSLYEQCGQGGPNTPVHLASPQISGLAVTTDCYFIDFATAQSAAEQHWGLVTTLVGHTPPAPLKGTSYVPPAPVSPQSWLADTSTASTTGKIWLPNLPVHTLNRRAPSGYQMPAGFASCKVFFPGTYSDPITLNGPTFFTSGVYYFENTVTVAGGADVVAGLGAEQGCSDDQEAAFYAVGAPANHSITGLGATFVFGNAGRLVVDNANNGTINLRFNQRYVQPGDVGAAPSQGVSIMSVNGKSVAGVGGPLDIPGANYVPLSLVGGDGAVVATAQDYVPSTLTVETANPPTAGGPAPVGPLALYTPIIDIQLSKSATANISIPGYVSVPMGIMRVDNPHSQNVHMAGGALVGTFTLHDARAGNPEQAQTVDIGFLQTTVQRTFRIVSTNGRIHSTAVVQVNQNGAYAINSWEVQ